MNTQQTQVVSAIISALRRAAGLLNSDHSALRTEIIETCDRLNTPICRIAVFGPFNYGKSTLLNAILGEKTLPMDLVPTTGAAIVVKYGEEHKTRITRTGGLVQESEGTQELQDFAVLDEQRRMRADVSAVEVFCPHPLLKLGIELIDLPGTDDAIAQEDLVQQQLLGADVVIQMLDGRKLMTLAEREHLRDWLLDRGIETVLFVVNFLNLMESSDRQQVSLRLRFLAESFRANLPAGVSNLYQVDALPALRARLKGNMAAAAQTGLSELESALQTIGQQAKTGRPIEQIAPRLKALSNSVVSALENQIEQISELEIDAADAKKADIKKKAQKLIKQGFEKDFSELSRWLSIDNLQANYRRGLADALAADTTQRWLSETLQPGWEMRKDAVVSWIDQASNFFDCERPADMHIGFVAQEMKAEVEQASAAEGDVAEGDVAEIDAAEADAAEGNAVKIDAIKDTKQSGGIGPVAIATGLGWILGGPLGAAVLGGTSHLINESNRSEKALPKQAIDPIDYAAQADIYLSRFSDEALDTINRYAAKARVALQAELNESQLKSSATRAAQRNLLQLTASELTTLILHLPS